MDFKWIATGGCVRGAAHIKNNMPCQDAFRLDKIMHSYIISVSDGHGSTSCPYSDEGAKAAVDAAYTILKPIMENENPLAVIYASKDIRIPKQIEKHWKQSVLDIHTSNERDEHAPGDFPYELYGATLLSMVAADNFVFALQIGDGDILSVSKSGETTAPHAEWFIPPDENLGPETNSLCQDDCWQYMKTRLYMLEPGEDTPMFFLTTDGYINSFYDNNGFIKAGTDFYNIWKNEGVHYIEANLDRWLTESSAQGSGDDIAVGLIFPKGQSGENIK